MQDPAKPPGPRPVPDPGQALAPARNAKGQLLPGHTANPGGRPKGLGVLVREMVSFEKAIETLVDIAWGKLAPAARIADRIKAIELLCDRGFGKPQQNIDLKDSTPGGAKFKAMPMDRLIATVEAMRALEARATTDADDAELIQ